MTMVYLNYIVTYFHVNGMTALIWLNFLLVMSELTKSNVRILWITQYCITWNQITTTSTTVIKTFLVVQQLPINFQEIPCANHNEIKNWYNYEWRACRLNQWTTLLAAKHAKNEGHRHFFGERTYKMETDDKSGSEQLSSVCKYKNESTSKW